MENLTLRQQEILGYILLHMRTQGTWPSFREVQDHFGFKSTNAVMGHIRALERKGFISRVHGQARTFKINFDLAAEKLPKNAENVVSMPVYGAIPAGFAELAEQSAIGNIGVNASNAGLRKSNRSFALRVRGDSMIEAGIDDGDIVVIEQRAPKDKDIVAALIDGETTLKRFVNKPGKSAYLKAENPRYTDLYPVSELVIQGVAKAIVREL